MIARPIAVWDPLRFGPLDDPQNRYLLEGVVSGSVADVDGVSIIGDPDLPGRIAASTSALLARNIQGEVIMLNLLRFRDVADYTDFPDLDPGQPISGRAAYRNYMAHTLPFLRESGGKPLRRDQIPQIP